MHKHHHRLSRSKFSGLQKLNSLWNAKELKEDTSRECQFKSNASTNEKYEQILLRIIKEDTALTQHIYYRRLLETHQWKLHMKDDCNDETEIPEYLFICPEELLPLRTAKIHTSFRKELV